MTWLLIVGAVITQYQRPTVVVTSFTTEGWSADWSALDSAASRVTRQLMLTLARDSTVQLLPQRVEERPLFPGSNKPAGARNLIGGTVRETRSRGRWAHWKVISVDNSRILAKDSVEVGTGGEAAAARVIATRISATLAPARVTPP